MNVENKIVLVHPASNECIFYIRNQNVHFNLFAYQRNYCISEKKYEFIFPGLKFKISNTDLDKLFHSNHCFQTLLNNFSLYSLKSN